MSKDLIDAINNANEQLDKENVESKTSSDAKESKEKSSESTEEVSDETSEENEEVKEDEKKESEEASTEETVEETVELTEDDLNLLNKLKDPNQRKAILKEFAEKEGLIVEKAKELTDVKQTKSEREQTLEELAREIMGDEYDALPSKAIEAIVKIIDLKLGKVEQVIVNKERKAAEDYAEKLINGYSSKYKDWDSLKEKMDKVSVRLQPDENQSMEDWMLEVYKVAGGSFEEKSGAKPNDRKREQKVIGRVIRNESKPSVKPAKEVVTKPSGKAMSLKESIDSAFEQFTKQ